MASSGLIYGIHNLVTDKWYVGQTSKGRYRWWQHRYLLRRGECHNRHLQAAWNKYGEEAFEYVVLEESISQEELTIREEFWLAEKRSSGGVYNVRPVADSVAGTKRAPISAEHKAAISTACKGRVSPMKGRRHSEETKAKMSAAHMGHVGCVHSVETKKHLSEIQKGRVISVETRLRMSVAQKKRQAARRDS